MTYMLSLNMVSILYAGQSALRYPDNSKILENMAWSAKKMRAERERQYVRALVRSKGYDYDEEVLSAIYRSCECKSLVH